MSAIPSSLARVSNMMASRMALGQVSRTNVEMLRVQQQITLGRSILRPSDDVVKSAAIAALDDRLEYSVQRTRNLSHATAALGVLDNALNEANSIALQAKSIASDQLGPTSSADERSGQATVVEQMLLSLFNTANRDGVAGYVFGGSRTSLPPVESHLGGYRFVSDGPGLVTDLGVASTIPITLGAGNPVVSTSTRVRGSVDLNPQLRLTSQLSDLAGARGLGITRGSIQMAINGGTPIEVDLGDANTMRDVVDRVTNAIRTYETDNSTTVLGAGAINVSGESIYIDAAAGSTVQFFDIGEGTTGQDLGLVTSPTSVFDGVTNIGAATRPRLTLDTPVSSMGGIVGALGSIRISNAGHTAIVDLSTATTLEDVKNAIESTDLGVRVQINSDGSGIDIINDLATSSDQALSISEVGGNNQTATRLGIRSLSAATRISDFNFGKGVEIIDQATDPVSGLPSAALSADFTITLGDGANSAITIDLRPQDMGTVQSVLARINSEIASQLPALGLAPGSVSAFLGDNGNGIQIQQDSTFPSALVVSKLNNSPAAEQLGLTTATYDPASGTLTGEDRAKIRVDGLFSDLLDLRASLRSNNSVGIALAGERVEATIGSLAETRGLVGSFASRVDAAITREEDRTVIDTTVRSQLRDVDYAEAASRFSLLQTQLQAALQTTAMYQSRSLLDFLG